MPPLSFVTTSCVHLHGACSVLCPPPVGVTGQLTRLNFDALPECVHAHRFVEEWDANNAPAAKDSASVQGSQITSSSRDSLYKHFDKLTKTEQVEVLKDAMGRKERLQKLETMSDKFDDSALKGLSAQARLCANAVSTRV